MESVTGKNFFSVVFVGEVDHGKSTLIGRLVTARHPERAEADPAFVTDQLQEEREQLRTIETTAQRLSVGRREFILIDTPGHEEFLRNMLTGATLAQAAVVLVDAQAGLQLQTRRHIELVRMVHIPRVVVAVNKMDTVGFCAERFAQVREQITAVLRPLGLSAAVIPVSARGGDGVYGRSRRMRWYRGPTMLQTLVRLSAPPPGSVRRLRFGIQDVYAYGASPVLVGRLSSGILRPGMPVLVLPERYPARIAGLERFGYRRLRRIRSGETGGIRLLPVRDWRRGMTVTDVSSAPHPVRRITLRVFWLAPQPLTAGCRVTVRCATQSVAGTVMELRQRYDLRLGSALGAEWPVRQYELAGVTIEVQQPLVVEPFAVTPALGRIVLECAGEASAAGIIEGNDCPVSLCEEG